MVRLVDRFARIRTNELNARGQKVLQSDNFLISPKVLSVSLHLTQILGNGKVFLRPNELKISTLRPVQAKSIEWIYQNERLALISVTKNMGK
jgi:hypothetical protein